MTFKPPLTELELGQPGFVYIRRHFERGTSFCQEVLRSAFTDGKVFALVPEVTNLARALQFDWGGLMATRPPDAWLRSRMITLCRANPNGVLIFEDAWAGRKGDRAVMAGAEPKFFHQEFVSYFIEGAKASDSTIEQAMRAVSSFLFVAAFVRYPFSAEQLSADLTIDDKLMHELASNVQELYVSAYDRESYIVWQK
jgi:hypothetical protein